MNGKEKMEVLKAYLKEKKIMFKEDAVHASKNISIDLFIPKYRIGVHIGDSHEWFTKVRKYLRPIFIREEETDEFVILKLKNTIQKLKEEQSQAGTKKTEPSKVSRAKRKKRRQHRNRIRRFVLAVMGKETPSDVKPEVPVKRKRVRIKVAATPIKVGSSSMKA